MARAGARLVRRLPYLLAAAIAAAATFGAPAWAKSNDPFARYFYVDTLNSVFGRGWKRDAAKVAHLRNGGFCFSFVPQKPPPGYPDDRIRPPGNGDRHRVTIMGPGVTPVIRWEGAGLGEYDAAKDEEYNRLFDRIIGPEDKVCTRER